MKTFLKWISIDLSLTFGGNAKYYKSVHHPIPNSACGNKEHPESFQNKLVNSPLIEFSDIFSSCANWRGKKSPFWKGAKKGTTLWDYSQEHLVVIRDEKVFPFLKLEIILPLLCFLLDLLTNKYCRTWISMINLWKDSRTYQK